MDAVRYLPAVAQSPLTFRQGADTVARPGSPGADGADGQAGAEAPFVFSVAGIVHRMRRQLEKHYADVFVGGEISSFQVHPTSGHAYFTLKDQHAKLSCVMWGDNLRLLRFRPQRGHEVIVRGRITIYERGGQMQLNVLHVEPQGLGALQQELAQRLAKLKAEGLTARERKRPIPAFPKTVGVVTSSGGAALRDILRTILRRDPKMHVIISPAQVQGRSSAFSIVQAIERLDALRAADVIIVARGGGSTEELWAFNEEPVARAIARCSVPVVTGVGHETDTTIADHVADLRTSTPTAAAEHTVPVRSDVETRWARLESRLKDALQNRVDHYSRRLLSLEKQIADPTGAIGRRAQHLDELVTRAERRVKGRVSDLHLELRNLERRLAAAAPEVRLSRLSHRLERAETRLHENMRRRVAAGERDLAILIGQLESMSPLAVLARGYALVTHEDGAIVRRSTEVTRDDRLSVRLAEGRILVRVEENVDE